MRPTTSPSRAAEHRIGSAAAAGAAPGERLDPVQLTGAALILGGMAGASGVLDSLPGRRLTASPGAPHEAGQPAGGRPGMIRRLWSALTDAPEYPATDADRRTIDLVGLRLPLRATVAIAVVTFALLFDYSRTFQPADIRALGRAPEAMRFIAIERAIAFGLVPLLVIVVGFRDRLPRYGLTLGDWRWGAGLVFAGCLVMTPIVLAFARLPDVRAYYGPSTAPMGDLLVTNGLELTAVEFGLRGFLMLTLVRAIGPLGVVVATMPFVFGHLGKPELELFSTLAGGLVYGWLVWRTRSIVWGALGHTYILTLVIVTAAA